MATVIDKLLVQIGIDAKGLNKGMDATIKKLKDTEKKTDKIAKKNRKNYKDLSNDSEEYAEDLKEENKQYALISNSLKGMAKGFVAVAASRKVLSTVADLGDTEKVAKFLGMSTTQVGTLQNLSENLGDSSKSILNNVADMYNAITGLEVEGKGSELFKYFSRIGVSVTDQNGKLKDTRTLLTDVRKGLMGIEDERKRAYMARQMGLGEGLSFLFSKDDKEFNAAMDEAEKNAQSTAKAAKDAQSATEKLNKAKNEIAGSLKDIYAGKTPQGVPTITEPLKDAWEGAKDKVKGLLNMRNNNPGNIRYTPWSKQHGAIGQDKKGFAIFPDKETGSRAEDDLLQNYIARGRNTLKSIIEKYAPPQDKNDTVGYYSNLAKRVGVGVNEEIDPKNKGLMTKIAKEIARIEGDPNAYVEKQMLTGTNKETPKLNSYVESLKGSNQPFLKIPQQQAADASGITINGDITVNTQATDAKGMVRDLSQQIGRKSALAEGNMH